MLLWVAARLESVVNRGFHNISGLLSLIAYFPTGLLMKPILIQVEFTSGIVDEVPRIPRPNHVQREDLI